MKPMIVSLQASLFPADGDGISEGVRLAVLRDGIGAQSLADPEMNMLLSGEDGVFDVLLLVPFVKRCFKTDWDDDQLMRRLSFILQGLGVATHIATQST